jgi:hypothetical protein
VLLSAATRQTLLPRTPGKRVIRKPRSIGQGRGRRVLRFERPPPPCRGLTRGSHGAETGRTKMRRIATSRRSSFTCERAFSGARTSLFRPLRELACRPAESVSKSGPVSDAFLVSVCLPAGAPGPPPRGTNCGMSRASLYVTTTSTREVRAHQWPSCLLITTARGGDS